MLKYLTKITMDILPSVVATIIGAYIVNHYIATKPGAEAPVAAAVAPATPRKIDATLADVGNMPAAGVRAKGISERAIFEKSGADKPQEKAAEKPAEKPAVAEKSSEPGETETASISSENHRRAPAPREKTAVRLIPLTAAAQPAVQPAASVAVAPAPTVEAAITPEEHRDANDLARAAIERLRGSSESGPRAQEAARAPDALVRTGSVSPPPVAQAAAVRPLPPSIVVTSPPTESFAARSQPNPVTAQANDPRRPIPPADIPPPAPVDLRVDPPHGNVAEDMLMAAKSVFHSVIPQ